MVRKLSSRKVSGRAVVRAPGAALKRIGTTLLAAVVFAAWIAALPALSARDGLSWHVAPCGAPAYRDPVSGRATSPSGSTAMPDCGPTATKATR